MQYDIKSFQGVWSQKKLYSIITVIHVYIERYRVTQVSIKIPDVLPVSLGFTQLVGSLNALCERTGIKPRYHTFSEVKGRHIGNAKHNSANLITAIIEKHPELMPEYRREQKNKEAYYYKMFEAVAVAHMT